MSTKKTALTASLTTAITGFALLGASAAEVPATGHDVADEHAALEALSNEQGRTEIGALIEGDAPVSLLVDAVTGKVLAANILPVQAFVPVLPDCARTVVCTRTDETMSSLPGAASTRTGSR
ncbi:hypothetical protein [Curtobacterium luteum]|uniref:Uncharacterized protein n=1 Tax=Curtobacterium luteum TaxID=33881 RepID=A0A175RKC0_9MICO|nr:hypothetical protein [Curtobacterium luteum]KTR03813.1 hypothetical protein NS184_13185 [Curtobacterium luteum]